MPRKFDFLSPGIKITEIDESVLPNETDAEGPIIIGRTRKGPGMQPVKIRNLEDYVKVFGKPVPGGSSDLGDVWRDGPNLSAPTYAAYAAQSWLASGNSPITMVRLLGDQDDLAQSSTDGIAGWQLSGSIPYNEAQTRNNSTAYGLFIADSTSFGNLNYTEITLSGAGGADGSKFTIDDSHGNSVVFEWDNNDTVTESSTLRKVTRTGATATTAANLATAIQAAVDAGYLVGIVADVKDSATSVVRIATTSTTVAGAIDTETDSAGEIAGLGALAVATTAPGTGALAAILYCDSGYLTLNGVVATNAEVQSKALTFVKSSGAGLLFGLDVYNSSGVKVGSTQKFNFTRNSAKYIRNVLNTNPQLTSTEMTATANRKTYWLGETFERHVKSLVTTTTSGNQYAVLLPLHKRDAAANASGNWGYHRIKHEPAKSGWVIADDEGNEATSYDALTATKLFRVESLHSGDDLQKETLIQIDNIKLAANPLVYPYGSFSLKVVNTAGNALETYNDCNLDPNSTNFVARRIGNQKLVWDDDAKKFDVDFDHPNVSDYIRIEMYAETADNYKQTAVPFGFLGPARPKSFMLISGSANAHNALGGSSFGGAFIRGSGSVPDGLNNWVGNNGNFVSGSTSDMAIKFEFPKLLLRAKGNDGLVSNQFKAVFGVRPKVSTSSNLHDSDFCDYLAGMPGGYSAQTHNPSGDFEYSFAFSLDDIHYSPGTNTLSYVSGSRQRGTANGSYTAASGGVSALLDKKCKQFIMPLFGGRHGLDVKEMEPFRNAKMSAMGTSDTTNYLRYSIKKAIDAVADPEYVPANLMVVPGIYDTQITNKMVALADSRQDILSIIDLDGDYKSIYESTESAATRRGSVSTVISNLKDRNIDSTFSCTFFPWVQVVDGLNNSQRVWIPSSVAGLGAMAQSEAATAAWFAPAGFNRGGLGNLGGSAGPRVVQARSRVDSDERDRLYAEANINPIATFPNEGVVIFGQKTLQSGVTSALGRINVRRLLIYLKSRINTVAKTILFDNNVSSTWARFRARAEPILADTQARFGLTEYKLVLDETTTTADLIDRNIMYAQIYLKPARAIEFIAIDFIITRSGAEFA